MKNIIKNIWVRIVLFIICGLFLLFLLSANYKEPAPAASLVNTYWRLAELDGNAIVTAEGRREMKFTLRGENKVTGYGGCNSFFGRYTFDESKLSFSQLAATKMFCADTTKMENMFMKSLAEVSVYKITGQILQLSDDDGRLLARLQAVYLK
jgi:putative lipoprotein